MLKIESKQQQQQQQQQKQINLICKINKLDESSRSRLG